MRAYYHDEIETIFQECYPARMESKELTVYEYKLQIIRLARLISNHAGQAGWIIPALSIVDETYETEITSCIAFINMLNEQAEKVTPPLIDAAPLQELIERLKKTKLIELETGITVGKCLTYCETVKSTLVRLDEVTTLIREVNNRQKHPYKYPFRKYGIDYFFDNGGHELIDVLCSGIPFEDL